MVNFSQLFSVFSVLVVAYSSALPSDRCYESTQVSVGDKVVSIKTTGCEGYVKPALKKRTSNMCGTVCKKSCNMNAGNLPPADEDCQTIKDAINIFYGEAEPSFDVPAGQNMTLVYNTCQYAFMNNSTQTLTYCWKDMGTTASNAGIPCFPPTQPFFSEGMCISGSKQWTVSAGHA